MPGTSQHASAQQESDQEAASTPQSTQPNPDTSGKYHVGDGVTTPRAIYKVDPEFTDKARKKKLGGTCVIGMVVDTTGTPQDVHVVKSIAEGIAPKLRSVALGLDANAIDAAKQYRFKPAMFQGTAVPVEITVDITYRIF